MLSITVNSINHLYNFSWMVNHNTLNISPIKLDNTSLLANTSVSTELYINFVVNGYAIAPHIPLNRYAHISTLYNIGNSRHLSLIFFSFILTIPLSISVPNRSTSLCPNKSITYISLTCPYLYLYYH